MDKFFPMRNTKLIKDILQEGFEDADTCFINWEKVTKKGNNAIALTEKNNLYERINEGKKKGLEFIIIVDEEHYNKTIPAEDLKMRFTPKFLIGISATVKENDNAHIIEIKEEDVISEKLITKMVCINENVEPEITISTPTNYLIDLAIEKQKYIINDFNKLNMDINPLILIQLPNNNEELYKDILKYLQTKLKKEEIAIWLSSKNENTVGIEENTNKVKVLIMKQATAVGWDCPRAKILVKLRENMNEIFTIQTIGRIRRSINATHYPIDSLNISYLYTLSNEYNFSKEVLFKTKKGTSVKTESLNKNLENITLKIDVKEQSLERELNLAIFEIGAKSGVLDRNRLKTALKRIFSKKLFNSYSLLKLNRLEFMAFIINNKKILKQDIYEAIKSKTRQMEFNDKNINNEEFKMPLQKIIRLIPEKEFIKKTQKEIYIMNKNTYEKYPSNEELSLPEYMLLEYAEQNSNIKWIYKNGEKSSEYFSILYIDNDKKYNTFYPDFILQDKKDNIWIIETKGGENEDESTRNIDSIITPLKYDALKRFCNKNNYKYGIVREKHIQGNKPILKILFDVEEYIDSLEDKKWKNIEDVF